MSIKRRIIFHFEKRMNSILQGLLQMYLIYRQLYQLHTGYEIYLVPERCFLIDFVWIYGLLYTKT